MPAMLVSTGNVKSTTRLYFNWMGSSAAAEHATKMSAQNDAVNRNAFVIASLHEKAGEPASPHWCCRAALLRRARERPASARSAPSPIKSSHPNGPCQDEIYFA